MQNLETVATTYLNRRFAHKICASSVGAASYGLIPTQQVDRHTLDDHKFIAR